VTGTELAQRTDQVVDQIQNPVFLEQLAESLPEGVTLDRFKRVTITAVRQNEALVTADQTTLFGAIVRCAQDGLLPDGREAALVTYKGKVAYLPMIGGIRRIAAVYGWQIRTSVVYANDEFDYTEEPPVITHRPVRPGVDRGDLIAAYAVATHRDGRRVQTVLHPADIAKRKAKAQTQAVWNEWTAAMWEKSAGHDIFGQLSLDPADARVDRILREGILADPIAALYGGAALRTDVPTTDETPSDGAASPDAKPEEAAPAADAASSNDFDEPTAEDGDWTAAPSAEEVELAGAILVPGGVHKGKTLAAVAEEGDETWFVTQLKKLADTAPVRPSLETFVQGRLPDVWAKYETWKSEQPS
jgi:recombination protein RecT